MAAVGVGALARHTLTPSVGNTALPFIFFFPFVAVAAWFGGLGPGVLAWLLSSVAATLLFFELVGSQEYLWSMGAFTLSNVLIVGAIEAMHRTRAELTQSRDVLVTTLTSVGDGVIVADTAGRVAFLNGEAQRLTGWRRSEAVGLPVPVVFPLVDELTGEREPDPVRKVLEAGAPVAMSSHTLLIAKDGRQIPIDDSAAPIREPGRPLIGAVLVFRDATAQRKAWEDRARLANIVRFSSDVILSMSLDGTIQSWNAAAERLFGYSGEEIVGKPVFAIIPPELRHEEEAILAAVRDGRPAGHVETIRVTKSGERVPVSVSVSPIRDAEGRVIGASKILHDIRAIVAARDALAREKELLRTTLASIGDGVIVTDARGCVSFLNAEAQRLTGWPNGEAHGKPLPTVFRIFNEETRAPVENPAEKALRLGTIVGLANHTVLIARDGSEKAIDDSAAPIREPGGPVSGVVLVFRDVTAQKQAEKEILQLNTHLEQRVEERTRQLQVSNDELESFGYTVAHDLRSPLRSMDGFADAIERDTSSALSAQSRGYLARIRASARRLSRLIDDLLKLSRVTRTEILRQEVDLTSVAHGIVAELAGREPGRLVEVDIEDGLKVNGDPYLLRVALENLLNNAWKFTGRSAGARVSLHSVELGSERAFVVRDNGVGFDMRDARQLFSPFHRLHKRTEFEGTGIGLATVKRIMSRHGGRVWAEAEDGHGAAFFFTLP